MATCGYCGKKSSKASTIIKHWTKDKCGIDQRWHKVVDAQQKGKTGSADWWIARILGTVEPMTEEQKEERRRYNKEHKEEIAERKRLKAEERKRTMELIKQGSEKLNRKRGRNV